jgi:hypothetical protein
MTFRFKMRLLSAIVAHSYNCIRTFFSRLDETLAQCANDAEISFVCAHINISLVGRFSDFERHLPNKRTFVHSVRKTMFFDNLPLEITCSKCGKQINETVNWLKAESRKCPFCGTLIDTTEFRRGIDEATNRTNEMLRNLQGSLSSVKINIKL